MKSIFSLSFFLLFFLMSCSEKIADLKIKEKGQPEVTTFKKKEGQMLWTLTVGNKNEIPLLISEIEIEAKVGDRSMQSFVQRQLIEVPKKGEKKISIPLRFNPDELFPDMETGLLKVKGSEVAKVVIKGEITYRAGEEERLLKVNETYDVLFTAESNLDLNEEGEVVEKSKKELRKERREQRKRERKEKRENR